MKSFNSGRLYAAEGQRIAYGKTPNNQVLFVDIDRTIHGVLIGQHDYYNEFLGEFVSIEDDEVLSAYDRNNYEGESLENTGFASYEDLLSFRQALHNFAKANAKALVA